MSDIKRTKGDKVSTPRKTPSSRAREFKYEVKIGTDGNPWVSIPNKNMNYSWQPYGGTAHDKYIEKAAKTGDIGSIKNLDSEPKAGKSSSSPKTDPPKKVVPECDSNKCKQVKASDLAKAKKKVADVSSKTTTSKTTTSKTITPKTITPKTITPKTITPKYTKKTDKSGRIMYYNGTGKRTARKNVPSEYL